MPRNKWKSGIKWNRMLNIIVLQPLPFPMSLSVPGFPSRQLELVYSLPVCISRALQCTRHNSLSYCCVEVILK